MPARKSAAASRSQSATAYLRVKGAAEAIDFYQRAFGAKELYRLSMGDRCGHAEIDIGGTVVMLADEFPEMGAVGPKALGGTPVVMVLLVANADAAFVKAVSAGAIVRRSLQDEFYGYRAGQVEDPFGHVWMIQQFVEDVAPQEMQKRLDAMMGDRKPAAKPARKAQRK